MGLVPYSTSSGGGAVRCMADNRGEDAQKRRDVKLTFRHLMSSIVDVLHR